MDVAPKARVIDYGGEQHGNISTIKHWQLHIGQVFIADTSQPEMALVFGEIMEAWNKHDLAAEIASVLSSCISDEYVSEDNYERGKELVERWFETE